MEIKKIFHPLVVVNGLQHAVQRVHVYSDVHEGEHSEWGMIVQRNLRRI